MLHSTVNKKQKQQTGNPSETGFTMMELIAVFMIIAVMAAISGPGMIGFLDRAKVASANSELQGLLKEAQRSAVRLSKTCDITLPTTDSDNPTISASCVPTDPNRVLDGVKIRHNAANVRFQKKQPPDGTYTSNSSAPTLFNYKGMTDDYLNNHLVIVLSSINSNNYQKCIVISQGVGLVRVGNYPSNNTATPSASLCSSSN